MTVCKRPMQAQSTKNPSREWGRWGQSPSISRVTPEAFDGCRDGKSRFSLMVQPPVCQPYSRAGLKTKRSQATQILNLVGLKEKKKKHTHTTKQNERELGSWVGTEVGMDLGRKGDHYQNTLYEIKGGQPIHPIYECKREGGFP